MKRLILTLILCLLAGSAWGATKFDLHPTNPYITGTVKTCSSDGSGCYATHGAATITRINSDFTTAEGAYTYESTPVEMFATSTPGTLFVVTKDATPRYHLYKTTDYNATATKVFDLGDNTGSHIANVWILQKGLAEVTIGGIKHYMFIEYNVNGARVDGGTNDKVRLMDSTDGVAWTKLAEWNTNGTHYVRHGHVIKQDPYTGYIYVGFGDPTGYSGIIRWDGVAAWQDNVSIADYNNISGFKSGAGDFFCAVDLLFTQNYMHWQMDNGTGSSTGIWRANKDFSGATRIEHTIDNTPNHDGWVGLVTPSGKILLTDMVYSAATDPRSHLWESDDEGATYTIIGTFEFPVTTAAYPNLNILGNNLFLSSLNSAVKYGNSTAVITEGGTFTDEWPVIFHPVFWVSPTGTDAASPQGFTPVSPLRTLNYVTQGRWGNGSRIIMAAGTYAENQISPYFCAVCYSTNPGYSAAMSVIEGAGQTQTIIYQPAGDSSGNGLNLTTSCSLLLKNLRWYTEKTGANILNVANATAALYIRNCSVGNGAYTPAHNVRLSGNYDSKWSDYVAGANIIVRQNGTATVVSLSSNIFNGGTIMLYADALPTSLSVLNNTVTGYTGKGIENHTNGNLPIVCKNNIFVPGIGATADIYDSNAQVETDTNYDYNLYMGTVSSISNNGGSHRIYHIDPQLKSATDYRLKSSSPCKNAGVDVGLTTDFLGKPIRGLPDIGAYEYQPTNSGGGALGNWAWGRGWHGGRGGGGGGVVYPADEYYLYAAGTTNILTTPTGDSITIVH
jgi:hypothetical protein